jgi:RNA polymerase sigma-70 factor, ECF subfamily
MVFPNATNVTELLRGWNDGSPAALERLLPVVYNDLRRVARAQLRRFRPGQTLDTTALVHEAYLRLVDQSHASWQDRAHFMAVCAMAMRQILIDYARRQGRQKRGGAWVQTSFGEGTAAVHDDAEQLLTIDRALGRLGEVAPRLVKVVECRYFAGYSEQETAEVLGISLRTAQREWLKARAWLREELTQPASPPAGRG